MKTDMQDRFSQGRGRYPAPATLAAPRLLPEHRPRKTHPANLVLSHGSDEINKNKTP